MKTTKTILAIALLILLATTINAQNPIWSLPPNYIKGGIPQPLPNAGSSGYPTFFGATATRNHNAQMDAQGNLLFSMLKIRANII